MTDFFTLKACACGRVPSDFLVMSKLPKRIIRVSPNCCGEWTFEVKTNFEKTEDDAILKNRIVRAWNGLPRSSANERFVYPKNPAYRTALKVEWSDEDGGFIVSSDRFPGREAWGLDPFQALAEFVQNMHVHFEATEGLGLYDGA